MRNCDDELNRTFWCVMLFVVGVILWPSDSKAHETGFFLDLGMGYIENIPAKAEKSVEITEIGLEAHVEERASVAIREEFFLVGAGYETKDHWQFYIERFGVLDDKVESITTFRISKRFYFK